MIFEGTILENMTLYREGAAEQAIAIAASLGLREIIFEVSDGLDTYRQLRRNENLI